MTHPEMRGHIPQQDQAPSTILTREELGNMMSLEVTVTADFSHLLHTMRATTGAHLEPRPDGFHLTIIGPSEKNKLKEIEEPLLAELQRINEEIQQGNGIEVTGIGFIDGADSEYQMRDADKGKKTAFVTINIPELQKFREKIGLPPKDFHITIGFVGGDINSHIVGQAPIKPGSPKLKDVTALIPKKANQQFSTISLPTIQFGGLDGIRK